MGDAIHSAHRPIGPDHTASYKRTWMGRNAYCMVFSQTSGFTYDVVYRAGAQHFAAELPLPSEEDAEPVMEPELDLELKALSVKDFTVACEVCPELTFQRMPLQ